LTPATQPLGLGGRVWPPACPWVGKLLDDETRVSVATSSDARRRPRRGEVFEFVRYVACDYFTTSALRPTETCALPVLSMAITDHRYRPFGRTIFFL
jgi:hypothetical protein